MARLIDADALHRKEKMETNPYGKPTIDVMEKLVELLDTNCGYVDEVEAEVLADHLIRNGVTVGDKQGSTADNLSANGVTVQSDKDINVPSKWIPVTERLPDENSRWVLCLCVGGAMEVLKFDYTMWNWDAQYPGRCYMENYVTHWMPLPQPPKEVER